MSRKSKKRPPHRPTLTGTQSPEQAEANAQEALQCGRFRDAIAGFKSLIKEADRAEWRAGLAAAYAGRAGELAAKGMFKEALVMWDNRQQLGAAAEPHPDHLALLVRLGRAGEALERFDLSDPSLSAAARDSLRSLLAAHHLAGNDTIADRLPADDPIRVHAAPARAALAAYCEADDAGLEQALRAIPFRSPYRDWVQIIKALQTATEDPARASRLLAGVTDDSAFAGLRRAAELVLVDEGELAARLHELGPQTRRLGLTLCGWSAERINLFEEGMRLGPEPESKALLAMLHRHRRRLGDGWVRRHGLRLLVDQYPQSMKWLQQTGAPRPDPVDQALVAAWHAAQRRTDAWDELEKWDQLAEALEHQAPSPHGSEQALRVALALRRFAQTSGLLSSRQADAELDLLVGEMVAQLEQSLELDPDDLATYLTLCSHYRRAGALKESRQWIDPALARWPDDVRILTEALDTALAGGAFRKAAGFARRILELDPINRGAQTRLVQAHLDHALRRIRTKRLDLAARELQTAAQWDSAGRFAERLAIAQGLLELAAEPKRGRKTLCALVERLGDGLTARYTIATLALATGRKPGPLFKALGLGAARPGDTDDVMALLHRLRESVANEGQPSPDILAYLDKGMQAAAKLSLPRQALESACETLRQCRWQRPRLAFARAGLQEWHEEPLFVFHVVEAEYGHRPEAASYNAFNLLDNALERSLDSGDDRTHHRLLELLRRLESGGLDLPGFDPTVDPGLDPYSAAEAVADLIGKEGPGAIQHAIGPMRLAMLAVVIDQQGLEATCKALGLSRAMRRELHQVDRELGRDALLGMLDELLRERFAGEPEPILQPRSPDSGRPVRRQAATEDEDDDPFDQLDLFR